ncbi:FtsK/SpoIIIE domain-containing protein [Mycoplasmoides pirum]|uniref:FtsK/SpoIIIE domain-containing protein n=1 Tax=Mycoplasmoides pirum TaxID=2122 RepID=UPI00047FE57E|nr:FtsK/SpoIIIE domain-containing protein [Mycoplasmoides pirum]
MQVENNNQSLKNKLNIEWLTTLETNKNIKNLVCRLIIGILIIIVSILSFLRIPYFGEFLDGVIFDLFLFGTAKYFAYVLLISIGIFLLIYKKKFWRLFANKRFILFFFLLMSIFSLVFGIVNFFQTWNSSMTIDQFFNLYFDKWIANVWIKGNWFWETPIFINGGLWWTIFFSLNSAIPSLILFVILAILIIFLILIICVKLKVKKIENLRKKCIIWLGGFYNKNKLDDFSKTDIQPNKNLTETNIKSDDYNLTFKKFYKNEIIIPNKISGPIDNTMSYNTVSSTQPFSVKLLSKKSFSFYDEILGKSENNFEKNYEFAKTAMLNLADLFLKLSIPAKPIKYHVKPSFIVLEWQLENQDDINTLAKHKITIQKSINVNKLDVYLKNENELDFQFPTPFVNKIHFVDVCKDIDTYDKKLECAIGVDESNKNLLISLYKYHTILILGSVGSGKGMLLSNLVLSLITNYSTTDLMLSIIDTKSSHLSKFENEPHLMSSIPNNVNDAFILFDKILYELKYRIKLIKDNNVESISEYNELNTSNKLIKPLVIVLNDIQDLANENKEYLFKFINTLNNHAKTLNCYLIIASDDINEDILNIKFSLGFGFKLLSDSEKNIPLYKNYLSKMYGNGDFVMFDNNPPHSIINRGLTCYINSTELSKILDSLKRNNSQPI